MKSTSPYFAVAALLLHAALIATVTMGLSANQPQAPSTEPLIARLLPPATLPVVAAAPPQQQEKKHPGPKPRSKDKLAVHSRETMAPQIPAREASIETKPAPPTTTEIPAVAAPATAVQPTRTSASDAAYASSNRKPPYPRLSRLNEEQGTVVLRVLVKTDGTAGAVEMRSSSNYPLLDESAKNTVQTWRFKPATIDGKPVAEWSQLSIPFTLQEN